MSNLPYLKKEGKFTRLYVDGKPFTALSGELHNSSSSSLRYMEERVWPSLRPLGMNSVILPIYWECLEPEEGKFDFALVDGIIEQADREGMKLILLWFGLWKNGMSTYIPQWMKLDCEKYFYAHDKFGRPIPCISPLCDAAVAADAAAYAILMKHIREVDGEKNTVIMMQAENEIGILGSSRDFSDIANTLFNSSLPENVAKEYGVIGNWNALGGEADELFMAYHYARAVEKIISRGKEEHPIPMFVNAWIDQFPAYAGKYPQGGPVAKVARMWKLNAPSVEAYAPDIYIESYRDVCDEYAAIEGNPLCIPEVRASKDTVPFLLYAIGKHNTICFSPFGIEELFQQNAERMSSDVMSLLNISSAAMSHNPAVGGALARAYKMLGNMTSIINKAHDEGKIKAFLQYNELGTVLDYKNYEIKISYGSSSGYYFSPSAGGADNSPKAGGFIIELSDNEFIFVGVSCRFEITSKSKEPKMTANLLKQEGVFENNVWMPGRILNGDEGYLMRFGEMLEINRLSVYELK